MRKCIPTYDTFMSYFDAIILVWYSWIQDLKQGIENKKQASYLGKNEYHNQ